MGLWGSNVGAKLVVLENPQIPLTVRQGPDLDTLWYPDATKGLRKLHTGVYTGRT